MFRYFISPIRKGAISMYQPKPINTSDIRLSPEILELAERLLSAGGAG
jgi:hypothetical protein